VLDGMKDGVKVQFVTPIEMVALVFEVILAVKSDVIESLSLAE
jgi:hypothetical protein